MQFIVDIVSCLLSRALVKYFDRVVCCVDVQIKRLFSFYFLIISNHWLVTGCILDTCIFKWLLDRLVNWLGLFIMQCDTFKGQDLLVRFDCKVPGYIKTIHGYNTLIWTRRSLLFGAHSD